MGSELSNLQPWAYWVMALAAIGMLAALFSIAALIWNRFARKENDKVSAHEQAIAASVIIAKAEGRTVRDVWDQALDAQERYGEDADDLIIRRMESIRKRGKLV